MTVTVGGPDRSAWLFCVMMRYGILRFVGSWVSASGHRLRIRRVRSNKASVDFFDPSGTPVGRPYMQGDPSVRMVGHYQDYDGLLEVDLWGPRKGFSMHLVHEDHYELDGYRREALVPSISRDERDRFLDQYCPLFGSLQHFVREENAEPDAAEDPGHGPRSA
jgi:hypothetical protein